MNFHSVSAYRAPVSQQAELPSRLNAKESSGLSVCRFASKVDEFKKKSQTPVTVDFIPIPKRLQLPKLGFPKRAVDQFKALCDRVVLKNDRGTLTVADVLVHLAEHGGEEFDTLVKGLPAGTKRKALDNALRKLAELDDWTKSAVNYLPPGEDPVCLDPIRGRFSLALEGYVLLQKLYPGLSLPETSWVIDRSVGAMTPIRHDAYAVKPKVAELSLDAQKELCEQPVGNDRAGRAYRVIDLMVDAYHVQRCIGLKRTRRDIPQSDIKQLEETLKALEGQGLLSRDYSHDSYGEWGYKPTGAGDQLIEKHYEDVMCAHGTPLRNPPTEPEPVDHSNWRNW